MEEVIVVSSEQIDVEEAEMDEMWSFVHDKSQQYWLWWAIDHHNGQGFRLRVRRERKNMQKRRIKRGGLEKW